MDEMVKKATEAARSQTRQSVPWAFDEPWSQPYYIYSSEENAWQDSSASTTRHATHTSSISRLALYSWNIDFMLPFPGSRMQAAIRHLERLTKEHEKEMGSVIFLQECVRSDLGLLAADPWVQRHYALSDIGVENWQSGHYGTVTLVDKRFTIASCFRVHYSQTRMERDGLFVDLLLGGKTIRLCNTHLESLPLEPPYRPPQMATAAKFMHDPSVHGAAIAGDFNAIQDFDKHLHSDNGLKDAYLELGGDEDDADGHTWGQQAATAQRERFGTCRMDKMFFCGGVQCTRFGKFGAGVEIEDEVEQGHLVNLGFDRPWITDHLGVMVVFEAVDSNQEAPEA